MNITNQHMSQRICQPRCGSPSCSLDSNTSNDELCCKTKNERGNLHETKRGPSSKKVENQIVRCTEITCMYSSSEEISKISKSESNTSNDKDFQSQISKKYVKIADANFDLSKDIVLEVDNSDSPCCELKDVQAVELVVAVQSAIKQRQDLIQEWKTKTMYMTEQIEKLQNDKICLEHSNLSKDNELQSLTNKLHELHKQYKTLLTDSDNLRQELEYLKGEYIRLSDAYKSTVHDLKDTKRKLSDAISVEKSLESRLKSQIHKTDHIDHSSHCLESELEESRRNIKALTISLEETTKELMCVKETLVEYKLVEAKLEKLCTKYKILQGKYSTMNACLSKAYEENSSIKETISNLNLMIESLTADKNELTLAMQCLNNEKNCLIEQNNKLSRELTSVKENFAKVQVQLRSFQSEVECLRRKIEELESCNVTLYNQLINTKKENKSLNEDLEATASECTTLSKALSEAQAQIDTQQACLHRVELKVRSLMNEKKELEHLLDNLKIEQNSSTNEINKLNHDNSIVRCQNSELIRKIEMINNELNQSLIEIKNYEADIEQLKLCIQTERSKHENQLCRLQEKIRRKSHEWKEYVTKEVHRLRNKRRTEIKKYLELNKDLENRLHSCQESSACLEGRLTEEILDLTTQLDCCKRKLEESIEQARCEIADLQEKSNLEKFQLEEIITKQKLEAQWVSTEMESKIQCLVQKTLDDEAVIFTLSKECAYLKEKIHTANGEILQYKGYKAEAANLLNTKHVLECELANCRGLLNISGETVENLKVENAELYERLQTEERSSKVIQNKIVKLQRTIGKKNAQIDMLTNTISQLKERLGKADEENVQLKTTFIELEGANQSLADQLKHLNKELCGVRKAHEECWGDKEDLLVTITEIQSSIQKLEGDNFCLQNELQQAKENQYVSEKALENSHHTQVELKDKLHRAEVAAAKSSAEVKQLECKLYQMQERAKKLEHELSLLTEAYKSNDSKSKKMIHSLECELSTARDEIASLRRQVEKSERHISKLQEHLKESQTAFCQLTTVFDTLREVLCQVIGGNYVNIATELVYDPDQSMDISKIRDYSEIISAYSCETEKYSKLLVELSQREVEVTCKLVNTRKELDKLSIAMKELQTEYTYKVDKLHKVLKEKDEIIKQQETQLVELQLTYAEADEALVLSLKGKIDEQQSYIKQLQDEKSVLQSEILCLAKKVNHLDSQIFELVEKLKCVENKNSKLQVRNISLEGDLEKLTLLLKEARDCEQDQICQFKEMMLANRELMEKVRFLKSEIEKRSHELEELKCKKMNQSIETKCCGPCTPAATCGDDLALEIKSLTERLCTSQKAEKEARSAIMNLDKNISKIKKDLAETQAEKASLEGWVSHLQQLISGGYVVESGLPEKLLKVEKDNEHLHQTINTLKQNVSCLSEEKHHLKNTVDNLSKCNENLEETISTISRNKHLLEKELSLIKKKVESLCQGVKSTDNELSSCTKDLGSLIENACSLTKSIKCSADISFDKLNSRCPLDLSDSQITFSDVKKSNISRKFVSDESIDSISVTVGCQNLSSQCEGWTECNSRLSPIPDLSTSMSSYTFDLPHSDSKSNETSFHKSHKHGHLKVTHKVTKTSGAQSKDSVCSGKSGKSFV